MDDKDEDRFSRTVAFTKLRKLEKEKDARWTGKVSFLIGAIAAVVVVGGTLYFLFGK